MSVTWSHSSVSHLAIQSSTAKRAVTLVFQPRSRYVKIGRNSPLGHGVMQQWQVTLALTQHRLRCPYMERFVVLSSKHDVKNVDQPPDLMMACFSSWLKISSYYTVYASHLRLVDCVPRVSWQPWQGRCIAILRSELVTTVNIYW